MRVQFVVEIAHLDLVRVLLWVVEMLIPNDEGESDLLGRSSWLLVHCDLGKMA